MDQYASAYGKLADDLWEEQDPSQVAEYLKRRFPPPEKRGTG
jgi:hypothetical protein